MVGVLPYEVAMTDAPQGHGYMIAHTTGRDPFFPAGTILRGHEFHNSQIVGLSPDFSAAYRLERGRGLGGGRDGLVTGNVLAAYLHLHADGAPDWAPALVHRARSFAREQN
jgi:cobyrinic acid a,c-diamide synthase